jgi:hypothetical protein
MVGIATELDRAAELYTMYLPSLGVKRLPQVLQQARSYRATDSRDKVYAFISHPSASEAVGNYPYRRMPCEDLDKICEDKVLYVTGTWPLFWPLAPHSRTTALSLHIC